jgi:hypothetical protein
MGVDQRVHPRHVTGLLSIGEHPACAGSSPIAEVRPIVSQPHSSLIALPAAPVAALAAGSFADICSIHPFLHGSMT